MAASRTKRGPKEWSVTEREGVKARVQQLDLHGYSQNQIVAKLKAEGVSLTQPTISAMLKEIQTDYFESYVDNRKMYVMKATAAHLDIIRQAQEEIARLREHGHKRKVTRTFEKNVKDDEGNWTTEPVEEVTDSVEDGDIGGYLSIITENWTRIARLHGLEELPKQVFNIQVNNNTINVFDQVLKAVLGAQDDDATAGGSANGIAGTDQLPLAILAPPKELLNADGTDQQVGTAGEGDGQPDEPPGDVRGGTGGVP